MREGYCVEVEQREDGVWIADWESYEESFESEPKHHGSVTGSSPSDALRSVAMALYDLRHDFHE